MAERRYRLLDRFRLLDIATQHKMIRYTWSGTLVILVGLVLIGVGLGMNTGAYSSEGLLIGFGAIIVLIGIVRVLIGFINPLSPSDLNPAPSDEQAVEDAIFEKEKEEDVT